MNAGQRRKALTYGTACASFFWLTHAVENPNLLESPRLSFVLVCLIGWLVTLLGASHISRWLPGASGRFDNEVSTANSSSSNLPPRPRIYFLPLLTGLIVLRLEVFLGIEYQCSLPGVEVFVPLIVLCRQLRLTQPETGGNDLNLDPSPGQAFRRVSIVGSTLICLGARLAALPINRSTYFCSSGSSRAWTVVLQILGIAAEVAILEILWRILSRQRTTKQTVNTIAGVFSQSAMGALIALLVQYGAGTFLTGTDDQQHYVESWTTYGLANLVFGCLVAVFVLTFGSLISDLGPALLIHVLAVICGLVAVLHNTMAIGNWQSVSAGSVILSMIPLIIGSAFFINTTSARALSQLAGACLVLVLFCFLIATSIWAIIRRGQPMSVHPLRTMISEARVDADRWLVQASTSDSLPIAIQEYRKRHGGREPPKGFDAWYAYAVQHKSPIIDQFDQIYNDLLPFWGTRPSQLRQSTEQLGLEQDIVIIKVTGGQISHSTARSEQFVEIEALLSMMQSFLKDLPDLQFAVNLSKNPRVLAPWDKIGKRAPTGTRFMGRFSRRDDAHAAEVSTVGDDDSFLSQALEDGSGDIGVVTEKTLYSSPTIGPAGFRRLNTKACPWTSNMRSKVYWNTRDLCTACFKQESSGIFLKDWMHASDLCHQPDMLKLHGFFMTSPLVRPHTDLLPIFSRSKPSTFSDILIPWPRSKGDAGSGNVMDSGLDFQNKRDRLFWRGKIGHGALSNELYHGGHQQRLVHLVNNASKSDEITTVMSTDSEGSDGKKLLRYETVSTSDMNQALRPNVMIGEYTQCNAIEMRDTISCRMMIAEFGPAVQADAPIFNHRYVLLTDLDTTSATSAGPGSDMVLDALESSSLPLVGSIFREWYSERLRPWLHFVPIDLRYTALHSTIAYFMGLNGRGQIDGRDPGLDAHLDDAGWIADQGMKWAQRAIRPEDAQIYLFRLLLEWARVISDERDQMNFVMGVKV